MLPTSRADPVKAAWAEPAPARRSVDKSPLDFRSHGHDQLQRVNQTIGFELLPRTLTFSQLQRLSEAVREVRLETRNFRKKVLS